MARRNRDRQLKLYKKRFLKFIPRKLLLIGLAVCAFLFVAGLITLYIILKPRIEQANSYDLEEIYKLKVPSIIYDRNSKEVQQIDIQNRRPVSIDEVPFHFLQALTAAEDSRFFQHAGVDYMGIARAVFVALKSRKVSQGASTITQQLARQSFKLTEWSLERKITEAFLARRIEREFSKSEILELYLNRIYFGSGFYGVNAAALGYFNKPVSELTVPESATICGLIKSPNRLSPLNNRVQAQRERNYVLRRMLDEKSISEADYEKYRKEKLVVNTSRKKGLDYVNQYIAQRVVEELGFENAASGGFRVYTTLDADVQKAARDSLLRNLARIEKNEKFAEASHQTYQGYKETLSIPENPLQESPKSEEEQASNQTPPYLQGSLLMIDNNTGAIIAMVGGRDYKHTEFNRATQAHRPVGTAFKPFVYAAAFEKDYFPGTTLKDDIMDNRRVMIGGTTGILGEWGTESETADYEGPIPARDALVKSKNAATVRLGIKVGLTKVIDLAKTAGVEANEMAELNNTFLGSNVASLAEMCKAYTVFPNKGVRPQKLHIITAIRDGDGKKVYSPEDPTKNPVSVTDEIAAYQVHSCLREVLTRGSAQAATAKYGLKDKFAAGKTGTAYDFTDVWFLGYNSSVTCGVWAGFDKPRTPIYYGAFSDNIALPVWVDAMNATSATGRYPSVEIEAPPDAEYIEVCRRSGLRATDNCYDEVAKPDGQSRFIRTTYREIARKGTIFRNFCTYHSKPHAFPQEPVFPDPVRDPARHPYPLVASNQSNARAIPIMAPTLIGDEDPYESVKPVLRAMPSETPGEKREIRRATPVNMIPIGESKTVIDIERPKRIEVPSPD